jgi:hypothetical protein
MPLPVAQPVHRLSEPLELTDFGAPAVYAGWMVICNLDVDLSTNLDAADMADSTLPMTTRMASMEHWISSIVAEWNFVTTVQTPALDPETEKVIPGQFTETVQPLPQPSQGGARYCRQELLPAIAQAFAKAIQPSPNSSTPSKMLS